MKRNNIYSILINHGFKAPKTINSMFFRGYLFYFLSNVLEGQDASDAREAISAYSDEQFHKLLNRLLDNGHTL